ncbi:MAG: hypothetical protein KTR31_29315 [Myxococcales bacterium]|nr:hypothetical protein [Myxococcales bacterium]
MVTGMDPDVLAAALARIERAARRVSTPPGVSDLSLPIQTLVVSAEGFRPGTMNRAGRAAMLMVHAFASDCVVLWRGLRLPGWEALPTDPVQVDDLLGRLDSGDAGLATRWPEAVLAHEVYRRVTHRLAHQPVQDLRVDFFSTIDLPEEEVDDIAVGVAHCLLEDHRSGLLPPRVGVRLGSIQPGAASRTLRILGQVMSVLSSGTEGTPDPFLISVAGASSAEGVAALVQLLGHLEERCGLRRSSLRLELAVDRAESVLDDTGRVRVRELIAAARGRCDVVRIDTDALASAQGTGVAHLVRDLVRLSVAGLPVQLSSGASPPLPDMDDDDVLSATQRATQFAEVHAAWRTHAEHVLEQQVAGTPWGWDLDPGQLPARLAATMAHARSTWTTAMRELAGTLRRALAERPCGPEVLADGQARLETVLRWLDCGALDASELARAGLDAQDIGSRSFQVIVDRRRA